VKRIKYNLKNILLEDPFDTFGYGKNPHLPPDVADYSEPGEPEERGWDDEELEEGMSDSEWQAAKEAERLEKHPEKSTIKKIQKFDWQKAIDQDAEDMKSIGQDGEGDDVEEEDVGPNYDPQLSGWEEMEKLSQEQKKANRKQAWRDLFKKTYEKEQEKKPVYEDPPEDDIIPIWNKFLPQTENDE
jgi:hypothetical protein